MSDTLHSSVLDGLDTRPLSDFRKLNPDSFKKVQITEETSDKKIIPLVNPDIKVIKSKEYDESVDELVKRVVVRVKVEAGRTKNVDNIKRYAEIESYALNNSIISPEELKERFEVAEVKQNVQDAESVLNNVDEYLLSPESLNIENLTEVCSMGLKLNTMLDSKLDAATINKIKNALMRVENVINYIQDKVTKQQIDEERKNNIQTVFIKFIGLFSPKLSTSN